MHFLVEKAAKFAALAHAGQVRKYNGRPYIEHPRAVAELAAVYVLRDESWRHIFTAAAWLHDVVENCGVTIEEVADAFGAGVSSLVFWMTNTPDKSLPRRQRKAEDAKRLATAPLMAQQLKLIDRYCNALDMPPAESFFKIYAHETRALLAAIGEADLFLSQLILQVLERGFGMSGTSFLTGSYVYGTPHEKSDFDLVVMADAATLAIFDANTKTAENMPPGVLMDGTVSDRDGENSSGSFKFGQLNLIVCLSKAQFEVWKIGTEALMKRRPVSRNAAIRVFRRLRDMAMKYIRAHGGAFSAVPIVFEVDSICDEELKSEGGTG